MDRSSTLPSVNQASYARRASQPSNNSLSGFDGVSEEDEEESEGGIPDVEIIDQSTNSAWEEQNPKNELPSEEQLNP